MSEHIKDALIKLNEAKESCLKENNNKDDCYDLLVDIEYHLENHLAKDKQTNKTKG